ncbi:hypothetical protein [Laspinema palackyanum]
MVRVEPINPKKYGKKGYKNQLKFPRVAVWQPEIAFSVRSHPLG